MVVGRSRKSFLERSLYEAKEMKGEISDVIVGRYHFGLVAADVECQTKRFDRILLTVFGVGC